MNYIVDDYTILMFSLSFIYFIYYRCITICLLPDFNFGRAGDSLNSKQETLHEHYIPAKYTYLNFIIYLASLLVILTVIWLAWLGNEFQLQEQTDTAFQQLKKAVRHFDSNL